MIYFIYQQTTDQQTGVYICRNDGKLDQYTGNGHKSTEEAAKVLSAAGVPYQIVVDKVSSGNDRG